MFRIKEGTINNHIVAVLMAIYVFFAGLPYGNAPAKVEFTVETEMYTCEDNYGNKYPACHVGVTVENIGKPFIGWNDDEAHVRIYRIVDGEEKFLPHSVFGTYDACEPFRIIIKHGDIRTFSHNAEFTLGYEPGEYILEVTVDHSDKVYTETITLT